MLPWCSLLSLHNKNHVHIQSCCPHGGENPVFQEKCKILLNIFSAQPHLCFADVPSTFLLFTPRHHSSQRLFTFPLWHCFGDSSGSKVPISRGMSCPHLGPPHTYPPILHPVPQQLHLTMSELCSRSSCSSSPICSSSTSVAPFLEHFFPSELLVSLSLTPFISELSPAALPACAVPWLCLCSAFPQSECSGAREALGWAAEQREFAPEHDRQNDGNFRTNLL